MKADNLTPFHVVRDAVAAQFARMLASNEPLFQTDAPGDELWATYLSSFHEGANPIHKTRTEHDCQSCKQFIRAVGGAVTVAEDLSVATLWDVPETVDLGRYRPVVDALAARVRSASIANLYLRAERQVGVAKNFQQLLDPQGAPYAAMWEHFHVQLPPRCVAKPADIGPRLSDARAAHDVLERGLRELTAEAFETVLDLSAQGSLYRGEEFRGAVAALGEEKARFDALSTEAEKARFAWRASATLSPAVARLRNTAIGTLLVDLSEGAELERAVASYESKMAPMNYRRPTALVTPAMVRAAKAKVEELGLTTALERRHAAPEDVSAADALFVDRAPRAAAAAVAAGSAALAFAAIAAESAQDPRTCARVEEVTAEAFLSDVLPTARSLEVFFENRHAGNLVSLVAPTDPTAPRLFRWPGPFSWSYAGDLADSIKARVKAAGGDVTGDVRVSLSWFNYDDLDLHVAEPGGTEIYFGSKISPVSGGRLDVDMNAGGPASRSAVENVTWPDRARMRHGDYEVFVHNYARRESKDVGFEVEVEFDGSAATFSYDKAVRDGERVPVATLRRTRDGLELVPRLPATARSKTVWGIGTGRFHRVGMVTLSPNYWGVHAHAYNLRDDGAPAWKFEGVGNRHLFFFLDGCRAEGGARGFYNEFLRDDLRPHAKAMEMVGARLRAGEADRQLSGLGFSSTKRDDLLVRVTGSFTRVVRVRF